LGLRISVRKLIPIVIWAVILIMSVGAFQVLSNPLVATALILFLQLSIVAFAPSALFGRWRGDFYKEKLEWDAFGAFLSDFAMIQKYAPEDINIWKEWLVYGTALGVGEKVKDAMADMNISVPEAFAVEGMHTHFNSAYSATYPRSSGSGGGGFGGGGGGFGGGGGGGGAR
jgi:uncharacterized membrane protein